MTFDETVERPGRIASLVWTLGVILLLLVLGGQLFWWERGTWLRYFQVWQVYDGVCKEIEICPPLPRLTGTVEILAPALSESPLDDNSLRLDLTLVNNSDLLQRPPVLHLELYNENGDSIAARRFEPGEYLPAESPATELLPGSATNVALTIAATPEAPSGFRVRLY
jgi:hypothetical protein